MRTLSRIRTGAGSPLGAPLPPIFSSLESAGIRVRRSQVTMIAAAPNGGKSLLALYWVIRLVEAESVKCLYFSADTDAATMKVRAAAIVTGDDMDGIERQYSRGKGREYDSALQTLDTLRCDFETDPNYEHIFGEVLAFNELWGDYPEVIVVDNLMNVLPSKENEYEGMREVTKALHRLARKTGAAVLVLHHMNESEAGDPRYPAKRKAITGKVAQLPEVILSLGFDSQQGMLRVACVKNRSGKHSANAEDFVTLYTDVAHGAIYDNRHSLQMEKPA